MTGRGTGAIATIQVFGEQATQTVQRVFHPAGPKPTDFTQGKIVLGTIVDGSRPIDQVVIGCEGKDLYAIHCHGNPLITEAVMALLERSGVTLVTPEALLTKVLSVGGGDAIQIEARLAQVRARTLDGVRLIANQVTVGLRPLVTRWSEMAIDEVKDQARKVLADSVLGRPILEGCIAAIVGPPNTGKSTLLNWLADQDKALVADMPGTTRDWVHAECRLGPLCLDLIDTAGLDQGLITGDDKAVEQAAQDRTLHMVDKADLVLLVLDGSQPACQLDRVPVDRLTAKPVLAVLNKSDLPTRFNTAQWPSSLGHEVPVSAKCRIGREALAQAICRVCGVIDFSLEKPVAFTDRQRALISQLVQTQSHQAARGLIQQLLQGPIEG